MMADTSPTDPKNAPGNSLGLRALEEIPPLPRSWAAWATVMAAAGAAAGGAWLWFLLRLSPSLDFGPWQGILLEADPLYRAPLVSHWLTQQALAFELAQPAVVPNLISAAAGALLCGAVAGTVAFMMYAVSGAIPALAGGLCAGGLLTLTAPVAYASTGAGPAILTAVFASFSLACFFAALSRDLKASWLLLGGLAGGLAAANHMAFLLLLALYVLILPLVGRQPGRIIGALGYCITSFAFTATWPLFDALKQGQGLAQVLAQGLQLPYPVLGDAPPDLAYGATLFQVFPLGLFLLAVPALLLLFRQGMGAQAATMLLVLLCFGPLLPFLTNQYSHSHAFEDTAAPLLLVCVVLTLLAVQGAAALPHLAFQTQRGASLAAGQTLCVLAAGVAGAGWLWPGLPERNHGWAEEVAQRLLDPLPADTVLVLGDQSLYSLLRAAQLSHGLRTDVSLVPIALLTSPARRARLVERLPAAVHLPVDYPDEDALDRWKVALPLHFARLANTPDPRAREDALTGFALWDLITGNLGGTPIAMAGVQAEWLGARAAAHGLTLRYPPGDDDKEKSAIRLRAPENAPKDPAGRSLLASLLLPLSHHALHNADPARALQLAEIAAGYQPELPEPALSMLQARARQGAQEDAAQGAAQFLSRWPTRYSNESIAALITGSLEQEKAERRLDRYLSEELALDLSLDTRDEVFGALWEQEQFALLGPGYTRILEYAPEDQDALYQLAAVHAQRAQWEVANELLARWVDASALPLNQMLDTLLHDPRFTLFHQHRRHTYLPGTHQL